jgi:integrative and conjugative element protein (TIGR02256 family)
MQVIEIGNGYQTIIFSSRAVEHMMKNRQKATWQTEAGGQLFARLTPFEVFIIDATGPRRTDKRTRTSYIPDRKAEQREIDERFANGLIYVGDWHTHPEPTPHPSYKDVNSISECFRKSQHRLWGFFLVIIGSTGLWHDSFIGLYARSGLRDLGRTRSSSSLGR